MRSDLESSKLHEIDMRSGTFSSTRKVIDSTYSIVDGSTIIHALDSELEDQIVRLPAVGEGKFFIVANVGATNNLVIESANGSPVATLLPDDTALVLTEGAVWYALRGWTGTSDFGVAGPDHQHGLVPDPGPTYDADPSHRRYLSELGWMEISEITGDDFFKYFTAGGTTLIPLGADTLNFTSANDTLTLTGNDTTDVVDFSINYAVVDHDLLLNFVPDEHVAHTSVVLTAGLGLSGGGDIAASRTFDLDFSELTVTTPVLTDWAVGHIAAGPRRHLWSAVNAIFDHNALVNYSANRHIDHTAVAISGGAGLTGGGTIDASRSIALDIHGQLTDVIATGDEFIYWDVSGSDFNKITLLGINQALDITSLINYSANKFVDHTSVSVIAGSGLTGGGDISASRTLNVGAGTGITVNVDDVALDTSNARNADHSSISIATSEGIKGGGNITTTRNLTLDITGLTSGSIGASDELVFYLVSSSVHRKITFSALKTALALAAIATSGSASDLGTGTLAVGFSATSFNAGTKSSGTFTPSPASGNMQHYTNGGAHTLAPPSTTCTMVIECTNSSAGAITTSGFSLVTGDSYSSTGTKKHIFYITKTNSFSHLHVVYITGT